MANNVGRGGGGTGFRPHELLGQKPGEPDTSDGDTPSVTFEDRDAAPDNKDKAPKAKKTISPQADVVASDVLQLTHRQAKEAQATKYKKGVAKAAHAQSE